MKIWYCLGICCAFLSYGMAAYARHDESTKTPDKDIIVKGQRATLEGGDWALTLSRSYTYGTAPNSNDLRPTGADKIWHICLAATEIEPLIRILVGEGQAPSATAQCSKIRVRLGGGKISATQSCSGTTMLGRSTDATNLNSANLPNNHGIGLPDINAHDAPEHDSEPPIRAKNTLNISGIYSGDQLRLEFADVQEPEVQEPSADGVPIRTERHWSIKGERQGSCVKPH